MSQKDGSLVTFPDFQNLKTFVSCSSFFYNLKRKGEKEVEKYFEEMYGVLKRGEKRERERERERERDEGEG